MSSNLLNFLAPLSLQNKENEISTFLGFELSEATNVFNKKTQVDQFPPCK